MDSDTALKKIYERTIVDIVRVLPPDRAEQLIDFGRFLEAQILSDELLHDEDTDEITDDNVRWDALLGSAKGQALLEELAQEALSEHRAGRTKLMTFDDEGRLAPG